MMGVMIAAGEKYQDGLEADRRELVRLKRHLAYTGWVMICVGLAGFIVGMIVGAMA